MEPDFLNPELCNNLRNAINETEIFTKDEIERQHFNLICAVMDRVDSCVSFINNHSNIPQTEESLIIFLTFSDILINAVKSILRELKINYDPETKKFFTDICSGKPFNLNEEKCPTDDNFFAYFRSLAFAHPFETSYHKWALKHDGEIHYSPYVLVKDYFFNIKDAVGVKIYSNKSLSDLGDSLVFSFSVLKDYIKSKYLLLELATEKIVEIINTKENIWRERKVNRNLTPTETLREIVDILNERFIDSSYIEDLIDYLTCETSIDSNSMLVDQFRMLIISFIPDIADGIDNMDYETSFKLISKIVDCRPKNCHTMMHYQLEKIYCYLNEGHGSFDWGLRQAEAFSIEFAQKWVQILPSRMSFEEIKLLTTIACYFETKEQEC